MTPRLRPAIHVVLALGCVLGGFAAGRWTAPPPPAPIAAEDPALPPLVRPAWRDALDAARAVPEADPLRRHAMDAVNEAEADFALAEAIGLLGWTGSDRDVPWLVSVAWSRDPVLSEPAILALGRLGTPSAVDALLSLLDDAHVSRYAVIDALGHAAHPRAQEALAERLADPVYAAEAAAALAQAGTPEAAARVADAFANAPIGAIPGLAHALAHFPGEEPREQLVEAMTHGDTGRRDAAVAALASVRDPVVVDVLLHDLRNGSRSRRVAAAGWLGEVGDARAIHPLHDAALRGSMDLQSAAIGALARIDTPRSRGILLELVDAGGPQLAAQATWAYPAIEADDAAVASMCDSWQRQSWQVRAAIGQRLLGAPWRVGDVPLPVLALARQELADPPPDGNTSAVGFLLRYGDAEDARAVLDAIRNGPAALRRQAAWSLREWPSGQADALLLDLVGDADANVRDAATRVLLDRGGPTEPLELALLAQLDDSSYGRVEQLLMELGTPAAVSAVRARLTSGTRRERQAAVQALAWTSDADGLDMLAQVARDTKDPQERREVYQALAWTASGDAVVDEILADADPSIRLIGIGPLARRGPDARTALLALADDADDGVRHQALSALAEVGGPEVEARLVTALNDPSEAGTALSTLTQMGTATARDVVRRTALDHADPQLRASAVSQLGWNQAPGSGEILGRALDDDAPEVRQAAVSALEGQGTTLAARALARALDDDDPDIAASAAGALSRLGGPEAERHQEAIDALFGADSGDVDSWDDLGIEF